MRHLGMKALQQVRRHLCAVLLGSPHVGQRLELLGERPRRLRNARGVPGCADQRLLTFESAARRGSQATERDARLDFVLTEREVIDFRETK